VKFLHLLRGFQVVDRFALGQKKEIGAKSTGIVMLGCIVIRKGLFAKNRNRQLIYV